MCSLVWFLYTVKSEFSSKLRVYITDWSPVASRGSGVTIPGSLLFDKYSSLHNRSLNDIYKVAIPGQTLFR